MMETYTIPMVEKETIEKAIARFQKKAAAYGNTLTVQYGEPYSKERSVYEEIKDDVTHTVEHKLLYTELVEVFDLSIDCDIIRKDGYSIVAKLEHLENGNFVYCFVDESHPEWQQLEPCCDHCKTKHFRKNTFIVRHENGDEKQVGSTCLKDYCGIDPKYFAQLRELQDLFISDSYERYDFDGCQKATAVYGIEETIALAMMICDQQGYRKSDESGSNKSVLYEMLGKHEMPSDEYLAKAKKLVEDVKAMKSIDELFAESEDYKAYNAKWHEFNDPMVNEVKEMTEFDDSRFKTLEEYKQWRLSCLYDCIAHIYEDENGEYHTEGEARENWWRSYPYKQSARKAEFLIDSIRPLAKAGYCKDTHLCFVAFAPVAYGRYLEALEIDRQRIAEHEATAAVSNYVGSVGAKVTVTVSTMTLITSWENQYGYTYLYKIVDDSGNVLIWKSSRSVNVDLFKKLCGLVKDHNERDGVKQTVVTRCKAVA